MADDELLQAAYARARKLGVLKEDPLLSTAVARAVKLGILDDLSAPARPAPATSGRSIDGSSRGAIDYDPDAGVPGAASMTGTASNRVPLSSLPVLGRPRSRPYDVNDQFTATVPKKKQAAIAARASRKLTRPESRIAGRETYTRPGSFRDMAEGARIGAEFIVGKPGEADIFSKALGVPQAGLALRGLAANLPPYFRGEPLLGLPVPSQQTLAREAVDTYLRQTGQDSTGAMSRAFGETVPQAAGTMAAASAGGRAAAMIPFVPWWMKPILGAGGAIAAGAGGGALIDSVTQGGAKALLGDEANRLFEQRGIDQRDFPGESAIGRTAAQSAFLKPSTVDLRGLPMIARALRSGYRPGEVLASPLGQEAGGMAINRLIGGALPVAQEAIAARREGREMNTGETLLSGLVGVGLPDANRLGRGIGGVAGDAISAAASSQYARSAATRAGQVAGDVLYGADRAGSKLAPVQTEGGGFITNPDGSIKLFTRGSSEHIQALREVAGVSPDLDSAKGFRDITKPLDRPGRTVASPLDALRGRFANRPGVARPMASAPDPATLVQPPVPAKAPSPSSAPLRVSKLATPAERRSMFARVRAAAAAAGDPHPDVTAAQWAYESDWGRKTSGANNYFGVKDHGDGSWTGKSVEKVTKEKNGTETIVARFRSYDTPDEGIADLLRKKTGESRYQGYGKAMTPAEAARALQDGGYAQDSDYAAQLDRIMRGQGVNTHAPSGKAAPAPISSSMVTFSGKAKGDSGKVNPQLVARIQAAAEAAGIKASITTATTGHSKMTTSGNVSRHGAGHGVDIAVLDGVTYASNPKLFTQKAEALAKALEGLGATRNAESGHDFAVLFGFDDRAKGGNHKNHLHVSYRGSSPLSAGSPAPAAPPLPVAETPGSPAQGGSASPSLTEMLAGGAANRVEQQTGAAMNEAEIAPPASLTEMLAGGSRGQAEAPTEPYAAPHMSETPAAPEPVGVSRESTEPTVDPKPWELSVGDLQKLNPTVSKEDVERIRRESVGTSLYNKESVPESVLRQYPGIAADYGLLPAMEPWEMSGRDYVTTQTVDTRRANLKRMDELSTAKPGAYEAFNQQTANEFKRLETKYLTAHKKAVSKAIAEGKPVPPEVLADYPDLAEKYASANMRRRISEDGQVAEPAMTSSPTRALDREPWEYLGKNPEGLDVFRDDNGNRVITGQGSVRITGRKFVMAAESELSPEFRIATTPEKGAKPSADSLTAVRGEGAIGVEGQADFTAPTATDAPKIDSWKIVGRKAVFEPLYLKTKSSAPVFSTKGTRIADRMGIDYVLPGLEEYDILVTPPGGNQSKGTKHGYILTEKNSGIVLYNQPINDDTVNVNSLSRLAFETIHKMGGKDGLDRAIREAIQKQSGNPQQSVAADAPKVESAPAPASPSSLPASVQAIIDALPIKPNPTTGARAHAENYAKWIAGGRQGKSPDYTPTTIKAQTAQNMERKVSAAFDEAIKKPMRPQQGEPGVAPLSEAEAKSLNGFTGRTKGSGIWKAGDVPHAAAVAMLGNRGGTRDLSGGYPPETLGALQNYRQSLKEKDLEVLKRMDSEMEDTVDEAIRKNANTDLLIEKQEAIQEEIARREQPRKSEYRELGQNADGEMVYEDERGVRSITMAGGGIRMNESVGLKPGGGIDIKPIERKDPRYRTVAEDEALATSKPSQAPQPSAVQSTPGANDESDRTTGRQEESPARATGGAGERAPAAAQAQNVPGASGGGDATPVPASAGDERSGATPRADDAAGVPTRRGNGDRRAGDDLPAERGGSTDPGRADNADAGVPADAAPDRVEATPPNSEPAPIEAEREIQNRPAPKGKNFVATPEQLVEIASTTKGEKQRNLIAALDTLKKLEDEGRLATPEEQEVLLKFPGWGWTGNLLSAKNENTYEFRQIANRLTEDELRAARGATRNSHYTAPEIISSVWDAMKRLGFMGGGRVLEPSTGNGLFYIAMPSSMRKGTSMMAIEKDSLTGRIARQLLQGTDVHVSGLENVRIADNSLDLIVSNIPFGNYAITDLAMRKRYGTNAYTNRIHNYFFIKSIEKARPGGVIAFIVSDGFMDARDLTGREVRKFVQGATDFLGAIRLPNDAFAKNAGTEVTTDIVFLRKKGESLPEVPFENIEDLAPVKIGEDEAAINGYFIRHPEMVLGQHSLQGTMYKENDYALVSDGRDMAEALKKAIKRLPSGAFVPRSEGAADATDSANAALSTALTSKSPAARARRGGLAIVTDPSGKEQVGVNVGTPDYPSFEPIEADAKALGRYKAFVGLRDAYSDLVAAQLADAPGRDGMRASLKTKYDALVKELGGPLHGPLGKLFAGDPDFYSMLALEKWDAGKKKVTGLSDAFRRDTITPNLAPRSADSSADALAATLRTSGVLDMASVARLAKLTEAEAAEELIGQGLVFRDPAEGSVVTRDEYGSGNVKRKLREAEELAKSEPSYQKNVEYLKTVQPRDVEPGQLSVGIGAPWVPLDVNKSFLEHLGVRGGIEYSPLSAKFEVTSYGFTDQVKATETFGVAGYGAAQLFKDALNGKVPTIKDREGAIDDTRTTEARTKLAEIKEEWKNWIFGDSALLGRLTKKYNDEVNVYRYRRYDGSLLTFPGQNPMPFGGWNGLRIHQKNAVWRTIVDPFVLLGHEVGTGKTFTMITAAMELKRMGLRSKNLMVLKKSTIGQFAASFRALYPQAKLLVADESNWKPAVRKEFMASIATNDWDAVLVWHNAFEQLSVSPEGEERFVREEIQALEDFLREQQRENGSSGRNARGFAEKEVQNKISRLEDKLKSLQATMAEIKDDAVFWEDLGVDEIFVDEAQVYKNLAVDSQNQQLKNGGNNITFDMHMKLRLLRERGGGAVFATGTPLTNSISEVFSLLKYMRPDLLKEQNIQHFDAWVRSFAETENNFEQNVAGQFVEKTRYSLFKNLPELAQLYRSFADQVLAEDVPELKRPKLVDFDGKVIDGPIVVKSQPDRYQLAYFSDLVRRAKALKKQNPFAKKEKGEDSLLVISTDGRHVSLDPRLRIANAPDDPDSKINKMVGNILRLHKDPKHEKNRRTQLVFMDLGQPGPDREFDLYNDVTEKLVKGGVKREEIAWVQNAKTDDAKEALFEKVDTGQIRVLLGSRERMGVGVNVQKRLIAIHQADPTWRPDQFEQADGRILRHGNLFSEDGVHILYYVNEGSFDAFMYGKLKTKSGFIKQFQAADENLREIEDDSSESFSFAEIYAAATGEPRVAEYLGLENDLKRYDSLRRSFAGSQVRLEGDIESARDMIPYYEKKVEKTKSAIAARNAATGEKFQAKGKNGEVFTERKPLGESILKEMDRVGENVSSGVGTIRGFEIRVQGVLKLYRDDMNLTQSELRPSFTLMEPKSGLSISADGSRDPLGMVRTIENRIGASLDYDLESAQSQLEETREQLPKLIEEKKKPWRYEAEYAKAQARYMELKPIIGEMLKNAEQGGFGSTVAKKEGEEDVKLEIRQKAAPAAAESTEAEGIFYPLESLTVPTAKIASGDARGQWPGIGMGHAFADDSKYLGNNHGFAVIAGGDEKLVKAYQKKRADMTGMVPLTNERLEAFIETFKAQEASDAQVSGYVASGDSRRKVAVVKSDDGTIVKFLDAEKLALLMRLSGADGLRIRDGGLEITKGGELAGIVMPLADNALTPGLIRSISIASAAAATPELEETPQAEQTEEAELASPSYEPAQRSLPATHKGQTTGELSAPIAPASARIQVEPIAPDGKPLTSHHDLIKTLATSLNRRVRVASQRRGVKGSYAPATGRTTIKYHGDVETTAHEAGHAIDDRFGLGAPWAAPRARSPYDAELFQPALQTTTLKSYTLKVKRAESIAEWLRLYMFNPVEARRIAPTFTAYAEGKIAPEVLAAMKNYGEGVRRLAGASPVERADLQFQWSEGDATSVKAKLEKEVREALGERGPDFFLTHADKLQAQWQDAYTPLQKAVDFARSVTGKPAPLPEKDPMLLLRLHGGVVDKVNRFFEDGPRTPRNERIKDVGGADPDAYVGGMDWMLDPLVETSVAGSERNLRLAAILGLAERTIEKREKLGRDAHLTGIGMGLWDDVSQAEATIAELNTLAPELRARLDEGLRRYRVWGNFLIDYMVESGRLSSESAARTKEDNQQYLALQAVMEEGASFDGPQKSRRVGAVSKPGSMNRFRGSDRQKLNPFVSLMDQTYKIVAEADRNQIVKTFFDEFQTGRKLYEGDPKALESIAAPVQGSKPGKDENVVKYFDGGSEKKYDVHPDLFAAFKGIGEPGGPQGLLKLVSFLSARAPRYLITHNPAFAGRNLVRDAFERPLKSEVGSAPQDSFKRFSEDDRLAFYLHGGGSSGNYLASRKSYQAALKEAIQEASDETSAVLILKSGWDGYNALIEASEEQGRLAEYTRAFKHAKEKLGYDDYNASLYAASKARALMDFAVAGTAMRSISAYVPFVNAAIQGSAATWKAARRNPAVFGMKFAMLAAASLIPLLLAAARGKDDLEEYRNLPSYQRDLFFNFKVGPDFWVRIPKGFEVAVLASGIERGIDRAMGNERAFDGYFQDSGASSENAMMRMLSGQLAQSMLPVKYEQLMSLGGVPGALAEIRSNYDTFRQRHIVSPFEENIPLERRKGAERASRIGKLLGKALKSDPRAIDHFIQGVGGGAGQGVLAVSDFGRADKSLTEARLANILTGLTSGSPSYASPVVERAQRMIESAGFRPHGGATTRPNPADRFQEGVDAVRAAKTPTERDNAARLLRRISGQIVGDPVPFERKKLQNQIVDRQMEIVMGRVGEADPDKIKALRARISAKVAAEVNPREGSPASPEQLQRVLDRLKKVK